MACLVVGIGVGVSVGMSLTPPIGIIHRPVVVHLCPQIIVCPLCLMVQPSLVNVTSQPCIAEVDNGDERVQCEIWQDVRMARLVG